MERIDRRRRRLLRPSTARPPGPTAAAATAAATTAATAAAATTARDAAAVLLLLGPPRPEARRLRGQPRLRHDRGAAARGLLRARTGRTRTHGFRHRDGQTPRLRVRRVRGSAGGPLGDTEHERLRDQRAEVEGELLEQQPPRDARESAGDGPESRRGAGGWWGGGRGQQEQVGGGGSRRQQQPDDESLDDDDDGGRGRAPIGGGGGDDDDGRIGGVRGGGRGGEQGRGDDTQGFEQGRDVRRRREAEGGRRCQPRRGAQAPRAASTAARGDTVLHERGACFSSMCRGGGGGRRRRSSYIAPAL